MTEAELLIALRDAMSPSADDPEGACTTFELVELTGHGEKKIRNALRSMVQRGECECVRVQRENISGVFVPVPAYRSRTKAAA